MENCIGKTEFDKLVFERTAILLDREIATKVWATRLSDALSCVRVPTQVPRIKFLGYFRKSEYDVVVENIKISIVNGDSDAVIDSDYRKNVINLSIGTGYYHNFYVRPITKTVINPDGRTIEVNVEPKQYGLFYHDRKCDHPLHTIPHEDRHDFDRIVKAIVNKIFEDFKEELGLA